MAGISFETGSLRSTSQSERAFKRECSALNSATSAITRASGQVGYRIYFGKDGDSVIVLLAGGAKASQAQDIRRAQGFWRDYLEARRHGKTK